MTYAGSDLHVVPGVTRHIFQHIRRFLAGPGRRLRPRSTLIRYPHTVIILRQKSRLLGPVCEELRPE